MTDQLFLAWIHDRLERVHNEPPLVDYMHRLRAIILSMPPDQTTKALACNSAKELERMIERQSTRQPKEVSMTTENPIAPPPDLLLQQWCKEESYGALDWAYERHIAARGAKWGADVELKACLALLDINGCPGKWIDMLRAARCPTPPSLKEQALEALARQERGRDHGSLRPEAMADADIIRRALEALPDG